MDQILISVEAGRVRGAEASDIAPANPAVPILQRAAEDIRQGRGVLDVLRRALV